MPDPQLLALLKKQVRIWNQWQRKHANIRPDFRKADLSQANLSFAHLQRADLHGAHLSHTLLCNTNLRFVDLSDADLRSANLSHADLSHANLTNADLSHARLHHTNLNGTMFRATNLTNADLRHALLHNTTFADVDISKARGLDTAYYLGPVTLGLDTLSRSKGMLPDAFLRHAKVHENLIASIHQQGKTPFDYSTTFISYASQDEDFAQQLHHDLRRAGVWCWFAPSLLQAGEYFKARIDHAIGQCEKLLVIFSHHALASGWVKYEVEFARQKERKRKTSIIVPLRLDTAVLKEPGWAAFLQEKRHIRNFEHWKHPQSYQEVFQLILRDLQIPGEKTGG